MNRKRLPALDGLRGVGATIVVVYHTLLQSDWFRRGMYDFDASAPLSWLVTISPLRVFLDGRLAVLSFFVLSGFVLSRGYWRGSPTRWGGYYVRRGLRLFPPVLASGVVAVLLLSVTQILTGVGHGWVDLGAAGTSVGHLMANMGLLGLSNAPLNVVWWSMRWEVWFSIVMPALFVALAVLGCGPNRRFRAAPLVCGMTCIAAVSLQPLIRHTFEVPSWASRAILYLPMFGVGTALAALEPWLHENRWLRGRFWGWIALGVMFAMMASRGPLGALRAGHHLDLGLASGLMQGLSLTGVVIAVALLVGWPPATRAMSVRPVLWIGTRSYSLYLVHLPLVGLLAALFSVDTAPVWFVVLCLAASLALAAVFYRLVEAPSTRLSSRFGRARTRRPTESVPTTSRPRSPEPVEVG